MNTTDKIMALANTYAANNGKALLKKLYGTSQSHTEQFAAEAFKNRQALRAEIEALVRERDEADRRAGAAERRLGNCMNDVRRFEIERSQMKTQEEQS